MKYFDEIGGGRRYGVQAISQENKFINFFEVGDVFLPVVVDCGDVGREGQRNGDLLARMSHLLHQTIDDVGGTFSSWVAKKRGEGFFLFGKGSQQK